MIFDQDDFINKLNLSLNQSDLEIKSEIKLEKKNYKVKLGKKNTGDYSEGKIVDKVNN